MSSACLQKTHSPQLPRVGKPTVGVRSSTRPTLPRVNQRPLAVTSGAATRMEPKTPQAPARRPRDPGVTANLEQFHQGTARVNVACLGGDAESVSLFGTMVFPTVEGLVEEFGGEDSVSTRMLCTMAASSFAD